MKELIDILDKMNCKYSVNEPMCNHTTMKVGGNAQFVVFPHSSQVISEVIKYTNKNKIPLTVMGNGSNLLVSDDGINGVVVLIGSEMSEVKYLGNGIIFAEAGASLMKVCRLALENELSGIEFAYGIPGSCGGAAFMNAGAYGGEMKDVLYKCDHINANGEVGHISGDDLNLTYRHSAYYNNCCIITGIYLKLKQGNKNEIKAKMNELLNKRKSKQPLEYPSAGSTFKRPEGYFAAALIEECGLKGKSVGGAMVSKKHSGFVINYNHATCKDVLDLCELVKATVKKEKNIELEMEIRVVK